MPIIYIFMPPRNFVDMGISKGVVKSSKSKDRKYKYKNVYNPRNG